MHYFDDITVVYSGHMPGYRCHVRQARPGGYTLEYVAGGSMYYQVDDGPRVVLDQPAVHWHAAGHVYNYGPVDETGWDHYFVNFTGDRARRAYEGGLVGLSGRGCYTVHNPQEFAFLFEKIVASAGMGTVTSHVRTVALLEQILAQLYIDSTQRRDGQLQDRILDLADSIAAKPMQFRSLEQLAGRVHLSKPHFCRLFKQYTGKTPYDYVLYCRMRHAAGIIQSGHNNVTEAARVCGYDDLAQFSKLFHKQMGLSPSQYVKWLDTTSRVSHSGAV